MAADNLKSLNPAWDVRYESATVASVRRTRASGGPEIPDFLLEGPLKAFRSVVAEPAYDRPLSGSGPGPIQFALNVESDTPVVAVVRHPSGALTFSLPVARAPNAKTRSGRGAATESAAFLIETSSIFGPQRADERRGLVGKVVRIVIMKVAERILDITAKPILAALGRQWEKTSWRRRSTGWKIIDEAGMASGVLRSSAPSFSPAQRVLLLLHGTFSHSVVAFKDLHASGVLAELIERYDGRVYGFDHFSVSVSPKENARDLASTLKRRMAFDVVTHSRGGLVLRSLVEDSDTAINFQLGRAVLAASPNQGTPLATPSRWEQTLGWFANLLEMIPDNPFTTAGGFVVECLSWLAQNIPASLPGIASMDRDGDLISGLQRWQLPPGD